MMDFSKSSDELTASTLVNSGKALLCGVMVITDGTNPATIIVYDSLTAANKKLYEAVVAGADNSLFNNFNIPVKAETGLYVSVAGTGASCIVYYA